jgi:hypothetical protein
MNAFLASTPGGLFMLILKNPSQAQAWGLISAKEYMALPTSLT